MKPIDKRAAADRISGALRRLADIPHIVTDGEMGSSDNYYCMSEMKDDLAEIQIVLKEYLKELAADWREDIEDDDEQELKLWATMTGED